MTNRIKFYLYSPQIKRLKKANDFAHEKPFLSINKKGLNTTITFSSLDKVKGMLVLPVKTRNY